MKKILLASAVSSAIVLSLSGCGGSSSDAPQATVSVSGQVVDINDAPLSDVTVEAVYNNPGDLLNPKDTSAANGSYSLAVLKSDGTNNAFYLHASKTGYVTMNTAKDTITADTTHDIGLPTIAEAQDVINLAYPATPPALSSKAWIVADVVDASGNDLPNQMITINGATATPVYTDCDGTDIGASITVDCSSASGGRSLPAYIASFDANATVTVSVGADTQTVVVRMGEIADLEFTP